MRASLAWCRGPQALPLLLGAVLGFTLSYLAFSPNPIFSGGNYLDTLPVPKDSGPDEAILMHDEHDHGDHQKADDPHRVRLLCWIMTQPKSHEKKAKHVKNTWGRRCDYLIFMSSETDYNLPAIRLNVEEGRNALWAKTKEAFKYVYQHYLDKVDWVLKADDDTYVIVENLRMLVSGWNASQPIYTGCQFKPYVKQGYMSGGAGYVLSKEAVRLFVEQAIPNKGCRQDGGGAEDVEIGKCLEKVKVTAMDSRDAFGRHRFFPLAPVYHIVSSLLKTDNWFWKYISYPMKAGFECCSDSTISFHYINPNEMYVLEFLIYHLNPQWPALASSLKPSENPSTNKSQENK